MLLETDIPLFHDFNYIFSELFEFLDVPGLNEFTEKNGFDGGFLVSSKTGENVNKSFHFLLKIIIKRMDDIVSKGKEIFQ